MGTKYMMFNNKEYGIKKCIRCNKDFKANTSNQKYCNLKCNKLGTEELRKEKMKTKKWIENLKKDNKDYNIFQDNL